MKFDREKYFDAVRISPFGGSMVQEQVDGQNFILDAWEMHRSDDDPRWLAYFLATAMHETASSMQPIEEYGKGAGHEYGEPDPVTGECYYGRGYVQTTWSDNYKNDDESRGIDWKEENPESCYWHPELQLEPFRAAGTGYAGMVEGRFRSDEEGRQTLERYFNDSTDDPYGAREIINGDKHIVPDWSGGQSIGNLIAGYHADFLAALTAAETADNGGDEPDLFSYNIRVSSSSPVDIVVEKDET